MAWDSTMIKEGKTSQDMARIVYSHFKSRDTKCGVQFTIGGLYVRRIVSYVSIKAKKLIEEQSPEAIAKDKDGVCIGVYYDGIEPEDQNVTREHMIPINSAYKYLYDAYNSGRYSAAQFKRLVVRLRNKLHIACITKTECAELNERSRDSAPKEWWRKTPIERLERYRVAGLGDEIWVKDFLNDDMSPRWKGSGAKTKRTRQKKRITK